MIRYAQLRDVDKINLLGEILHKNFKNVYKVQEMLHDKITKVLVYEVEDKIVGFIIATCLYENVDILSLVVDGKYRRQGVASNLIDYLFSEISDSVKVVTLEVAVNNEKAINLYKKFGFEVVNIRKKYYGDVDGYLMGRRF